MAGTTRRFALLLLLGSVLPAQVYGANLYWDINGTSAGATNDGGGSAAGTWDTSTSNWTTDGTNGTTATTTWSNIASPSTNNALFSAGTNAAGTYTVAVGAAITVAKITIEEGNVTFSGANTITFSDNGSAGNAGVNVASGLTTITAGIGGVLGSGTGFYKSGGGTLDISSATSFNPASMVVGIGALDLGSTANSLDEKHLYLQGATTSGVYQMSGTYNKNLGTTGSTIQWVAASSGGFAARGGLLQVSLNGGSGALTFGGTANFLDSGKVLVFGSNTSDNAVLFNNALDFNNAAQTIHVNDNTTAPNDWAIMGGSLNNGSLTKTGAGLLVLAADNNTGGTPLTTVNISAGNLQVGNGATAGTLGTGTVTNDGTLSFLRTDNISISNLITGSGIVWQRGVDASDRTTLTNANTFTGQTVPLTGVLALGNTLAIQNSTLNMSTGATGTVSFGSLTAATIGGLTGTRDLNLQNDSSAAVALSLGNNSTNQNYSGVLSGTGSLLKIGTATQTLSGTNSYTGDTTVTSGTLRLGNNNRIADTSDLILNGGTFATGGFSESLATLDLNADSIIDLESGASIVHFLNSSAVNWGSSYLTINNWTGLLAGGGTDRLYIGTNTAGLTSGQLSRILFTGHQPGASILSDGEIVPVPEPQSMVMMMLAGLLFWLVRNRSLVS